jgi:hypothetical protein
MINLLWTHHDKVYSNITFTRYYLLYQVLIWIIHVLEAGLEAVAGLRTGWQTTDGRRRRTEDRRTGWQTTEGRGQKDRTTEDEGPEDGGLRADGRGKGKGRGMMDDRFAMMMEDVRHKAEIEKIRRLVSSQLPTLCSLPLALCSLPINL